MSEVLIVGAALGGVALFSIIAFLAIRDILFPDRKDWLCFDEDLLIMYAYKDRRKFGKTKKSI